jgi:hypothetical protein
MVGWFGWTPEERGPHANSPEACPTSRPRRPLRHTGGQTPGEDVARAAGVSTATAYKHFPTKHALIGAVYQAARRSSLSPCGWPVGPRRGLKAIPLGILGHFSA